MAEPKKDEESTEFRVVDRRPFTSEGERRADLPAEPAKPEPAPRQEPKLDTAGDRKPPAPDHASETVQSAGKDRKAQDSAPEPTPEPVQFEQLIMSLVTSAMLQLGMAGRPGQPSPPPDLPAAQQTIDLLAVLQQKTQGNLTPEEEELLAGGLAELRLVYVELARRAASRIR